MISVEGYNHFGGHHWETGSLRNVLAFHGLKAPHTGEPFSEALLLGLTGGIGVVYFIFEYEGFAPHVALGTRYPFNPVENVIERLGLPAAAKQTQSQKKSVDTLLSALVVGEPALVWADMFNLTYNAFPSSPFPAMMPIVVYAYGIEQEVVRVADRADVPLVTTPGELAEARARQTNLRNKMISFEFEDADSFEVQDLPAAVADAIRACVDLLTEPPPKGPANNFGLAALGKWAELVAQPSARRGWPQAFAAPAHLYAALQETYIAIEHRGSGGGAARPLYADFLTEAADILDKPALLDAARLYQAAGQRWRDVAAAALPSSVEPLGEVRQLIDESRALFKQRGNDGWREMQHIAEQLETLQSDIVHEFPLDDGGRSELLAGLRDCIEDLRKAETEAARALRDAIAQGG